MAAVYVVPSRGRPGNVARLIDAWRTTTTAGTQLCVITDDDDPCRYPDVPPSVGWHEIGPAQRIGPILNTFGVGLARSGEWDAVGFMGDDHLPRTHGWDADLLAVIQGGAKVAYGNDLIQGPNLPTAVLLDASLIARTGLMAPPGCQHLFLDDYWLALGRATTLAYLPDVIVEHLHPLGGTAEPDAGYELANDPALYQSDRAAFDAHMDGPFQDLLAGMRV